MVHSKCPLSLDGLTGVDIHKPSFPRKRESRGWVSFDKLRTNDFIIYLPLSSLGE